MVQTSGPGTSRPSYYDRNPTSTGGNSQNTDVSPHALTTRFTYTCPSNRKAFVGGSLAGILRSAAATTASYCVYQVSVGGVLVNLLEYNSNTGGITVTAPVTHHAVVLATQTVTLADSDTSTGGTVSFWGSVTIIEFDA